MSLVRLFLKSCVFPQKPKKSNLANMEVRVQCELKASTLSINYSKQNIVSSGSMIQYLQQYLVIELIHLSKAELICDLIFISSKLERMRKEVEIIERVNSCEMTSVNLQLRKKSFMFPVLEKYYKYLFLFLKILYSLTSICLGRVIH